MLDVRLLRCFAMVAEELHFGRAAERLYMTQPPLSQNIRKLEAELDVPLLMRNTRRVRLTAAGEELKRRIAIIEGEMAATRLAVSRVHRGEQGHLSIGLTPSAAYSAFPSSLYAFRQAYPEVSVEVAEMNSSEMPDALRRGRLDMVLMRPPFADRDLRPQPVLAEPLVFAVRKDHDLVARYPEGLTLQQAMQQPLIGYAWKDSHYFHEILQRLARVSGVEPTIVQESMIPTVLALVEAGIAAAIVPANLSRARFDTLAYLPLLECGGVEAELLLAQAPGQESKAVDNFVRMMQQWGSRPVHG